MANNQNGAQYFVADMDTAPLRKSTLEAQRLLSGIGDTAVSEGMRIDTTMRNIAASVGIAFGVREALQFGANIAKVTGEFQRLDVMYRQFTGNAETAQRLMSETINLAATTPFSLTDVSQGTSQLLAYGFATQQVTEDVRRLGDISAALNLPLSRLTYLYGTTYTQGRLYARDLMQFTTSGVPLLQTLADNFNVSTSEMVKMITAGKIGFPEVQRAIYSLTDEGGRFGGVMADVAQTIPGRIEKIRDAWDIARRDIGNANIDIINSTIDMGAAIVENIQPILSVLKEVIIAYGAYKAALMFQAVVRDNNSAVRAQAEIDALRALIGVKEQENNSDLQRLVIQKKLTQADADRIIALRAEAAEKLKSLNATVAANKAELLSAQSNLDLINRQVANTQKIVKERNRELKVARAGISTKKFELAQSKLKEAQDRRDITLSNQKVAAQQVENAQLKVNNAELARNTLQQNINNASKIAGAKSTSVLTAATNVFNRALTSIGRFAKANAFGLIILAITAAVRGMKALAEQTDAATAAQNRLKKSQEDFANIEKERRSRIDELIGVIQDEYSTTLASVKAWDELIKLSPAIEKAYTRETLAVKELSDAQKLLNDEQDIRLYEKDIKDIEKAKKRLDDLNKSLTLTSPNISGTGNAQAIILLMRQIKEQELYLKQLEDNVVAHNNRMAKVQFAGLAPQMRSTLFKAELTEIKRELDEINKLNEQGAQKETTDFLNIGQFERDARAKELAERAKFLEKEIKAIEDNETERIETERNAAKEREKELRKLNEDYLKLIRELSNKEEQARIDGMSDGWRKEIEQLKENHRLRIEEINDEEQALKDAAEKAGRAFTEASRFQELRKKENSLLGFNIDEATKKATGDIRTFYEKYIDIINEYNDKVIAASKANEDLGSFGVLAEQEQVELQRLANEYANKSNEFKLFMKQLTDMSEAEIRLQIKLAKHAISEIIKGGVNEKELEKYLLMIAKIEGAEKKLDGLGKGTEKTGKEAYAAWRKTEKALNDVGRDLNSIGDSLGGMAGEALKAAGTVSTSTASMINGISTLASAAATQMSNIEKASIVLAAISAAIQSITAITNLISKNAEEADKAAAANLRYRNSLKMSEYENIISEDSIFGDNPFKDVREYTKQYEQMLKEFRQLTEQELGSFDGKERESVGLGIPFARWIREDSEQFKTYKDALEKGFNSLQSIQVKTKDRSGLANLVGFKDKFSNLGDIAPEIFANGEFNVDAAKAFLETDRDISATDRERLEYAIQLAEQMKNAEQAIKEMAASLVDNVATNAAQSMLDSFIATGKAAANIDELTQNIAKNMALAAAQDLLQNAIFTDELENQVVEALKTGDYDKINQLMSDALSKIPELTPMIEELFRTFGIEIDKLSRSASSQGISQASQDSIDNVLGLLYNIEGNVYEMTGYQKGIYEMMLNGLGVNMDSFVPLVQEDTRYSTENAVNAMAANVAAIRANTNRLAKIEEYLRVANVKTDTLTQTTRSEYQQSRQAAEENTEVNRSTNDGIRQINSGNTGRRGSGR